MKYLASLPLLFLILVFPLPLKAELSAPELSVETNAEQVTLTWDGVENATGYLLYYTPYPYLSNASIQQQDLGNELSFSKTLWQGAAYYVAIKAYNSLEKSEYSNIEYFILDSNHIPFTSAKGSYNGLTLFAPMLSTTTYLMDDTGNILHEWSSSYTPGLSVYLMPDGSILRTGNHNNGHFSVGGKGGIIEQMTWDGEVTWQFQYSDSNKSLHHDIEPLPNGNILALSWELKDDLWTEVIVEIEKQGSDSANIVWSWDVWDHLNELGLDSSSAKTDDWIHLNSIDYNQASNQIMVSSRSHNQVWIINKSNGSIAAISSIELFGQHDAKWIDDTKADSNISIFDNGRSYSRSLEVDSELKSIIWSYGNTSDEYFYGDHISGTQRLGNGNTLVCNGVDGVFFELNSRGEKIWEYTNSYGGSAPKGTSTEVFRAEKYPTGYTPYF